MSMRGFPDQRNPRHVRAAFSSAHIGYRVGNADFPDVRPSYPTEQYAARTRPYAEDLEDDWAEIDGDRQDMQDRLEGTRDALISMGGERYGLVIGAIGRNLVRVDRLQVGTSVTSESAMASNQDFADIMNGIGIDLVDGSVVDFHKTVSRSSGNVNVYAIRSYPEIAERQLFGHPSGAETGRAAATEEPSTPLSVVSYGSKMMRAYDFLHK